MTVNGEIVGALIRRQEAIEGVVEVRVENCEVNDGIHYSEKHQTQSGYAS